MSSLDRRAAAAAPINTTMGATPTVEEVVAERVALGLAEVAEGAPPRAPPPLDALLGPLRFSAPTGVL
jgi:hypothetical protein